MKRLISLFLTLMLIFSLTACGEDTTSDSKNNTDAKTDASQDKDKNKDNGNGNDNSNSKNKNKITFTEQVIVDNEECLIKITEIDPEDMSSYTLKVHLENKSDDKTYQFNLEDSSVNGVDFAAFLCEEVSPGKKSNAEIYFWDFELHNHDIGDYTDIELTFSVEESNNWLAEPIVNETVHIYPYGEDKATQFVRQPQSADRVVMDNEYVTAIVTGYEEDEMFYFVNLFVINKTDKTVEFQSSEESVNGYMMDASYWAIIPSGKCAFGSIDFWIDELEENDITEIEEIEFIFEASDYEDWTADSFASEAVTLNP